MTKKIISVLIAIIIVSISVITFATTTSEINEKRNEIKNNISEAEGQIEDIEDEVDTVMSEINQLTAEILEMEDQITTLNADLTELNNEIASLEEQLEEEQAKYDEQYEMLCKRLVAQYKMGNVSYLDVLLNSKSLTDFISKYYIIGKIAEYDTKLLEQIEEQKTVIENSKAELEEKQSELSEKQATLKMQEINLSNKKTNKNAYMSQLTDEQKALQEQIDKWNEEDQKLANELAAIAKAAGNSSGGGYVYTGGQLTWPCPSYTRISSYFGYRSSSSTNGVGSTYHRGIDIAASQGNPIVAAESGTVIKVYNSCTHNYGKSYSDSCSSLGNYVMISHGNGLVTLYGHCTEVLVSTGQSVTAGQKIATVGSTGNSTGFHLHFGVILNGTYVDPAPYLGM